MNNNQIPKDVQEKIKKKIVRDIISYMLNNMTIKNNEDGTSAITIPDPTFEDVYPEMAD